ncbi:MAG TPA: DUF2397 family protein [Euzebyales bacterium]|nr:DUF2397 family protein [Euzebyales bacterium]
MPASTERLEVFAYVTADKALQYRAVSRVMLQAKERFRLHLRPAEIVALVADDGLDVETDELTVLLAQLSVWGNVRTDRRAGPHGAGERPARPAWHPDTAEVASVEEFYRPRHLYQLTPEGEAAERAVRHFEQTLVQPGALQTTALRDIRVLLAELAVLTADDETDTAKAHRSLLALSARFAELRALVVPVSVDFHSVEGRTTR